MEIGLDENFLLYALSALVVLILALTFSILRLGKRIKRILGGKSINVEKAIIESHKRLKQLEDLNKETEAEMNLIKNKLKKSIRAVETIRFNPFKGTGEGGNQSFSSAFVNDEGNGVVITGLYLRERMSIFAKPVKNFNSEFELTEEEKEVITNTRQRLKD